MQKTQIFKGKVYTLYKNAKYYSRGAVTMHKAVYVWYKGPVPKGFHIHHKNHNPHDNRIKNLILVEADKHLAHHAKKRFETNPKWAKSFQSKGVLNAKNWHHTKAGKTWHKQHALKSKFGQLEYGVGKCNTCGKNYVKKKKLVTRFCSNNCKSAYRRASGIDLVKRNCVVCNVFFSVDKYSKTETCSKSCAATMRWQAKKAGL